MRVKTRLYLLTPASFEAEDFSGRLQDALSGGEVACLQLRMKDCTRDEILEAAKVLLPICHENDVAFLINDHADIAEEVGADGVHLGQGDGDVRDARSLLGTEAIIGVTCHGSRHLAFEAGEAGADYVAFGAFYPTGTKDIQQWATADILSYWAEIVEVPSVAIGGIKVDNCRPLIEAGADFIAVSSAVWDDRQGPKAAIQAFHRVFDEVFEEMGDA